MPFDFRWKCRWNIRWRKMWAFLPAGFLHRIPCLFHVLTLHGMCPTNRRQWADSLVSLAALLHRQYKTARTETRRLLLLKSWQKTVQTSASRGYVLLDIKMAFMPSVVWCHKGHTRILKLSAGCGHTRGVLKTWKNTDHRWYKNWLVRNATFFDPNFQMHSIWNRWVCSSQYCLPRQKGLSASSDSPLAFWRVLKKLFV